MFGLSVQEERMFEEIGEVLNRHAGPRQFGLSLVHDHFELAQGETLHETNDPIARTLTVRTLNTSELPSEAKPTLWALAPNGAIEVRQWCCD